MALDFSDDDAPPWVLLLDTIIEGAYSQAASEIHIEPFERATAVRFMVDGDLERKPDIPQMAIQVIANRLRILSGLELTDPRVPQSGTIPLKSFTKTAVAGDLSMEMTPTPYGQKVILRLPDKHA